MTALSTLLDHYRRSSSPVREKGTSFEELMHCCLRNEASYSDLYTGIVNGANDWAVETMDNARHPLELFQRIVTVSLDTMKIVGALPKLDISSTAN